jgi:tetratricopeptide (TPR) repeat protein
MLESIEKKPDQQAGSESKARLVDQIKGCLSSGQYSRALDLARSAAREFLNDPERAELEKLAQDGVKRKFDADRLITESQELFAQQKSADAIQLLRKAYELDKKNSLARSILANALVEHANSIVETDWLGAETFANQALALNPAHPTAKTILSLIVDRKQASSVEDWVSQASKLQSSGDLFAALAWVAEGLAVHPHDPKLLQIQDAIQRDQDARRRQTRRGDLDELRRLQREIDGATDVAAKQALAGRIQAVAAKYWTDGEILSIANALLLRLGLIAQESSGASPRCKGATLILHVPRPSAPSGADTRHMPPGQIPPSSVSLSPALPSAVPPSPVLPDPVLPTALAPIPVVPRQGPPKLSAPENAQASPIPPNKVSPSPETPNSVPPAKAPSALPTPHSSRSQAPVSVSATMPSTTAKVKIPSSQPQEPQRANSAFVIFIFAAAAIILVAATFFFTRRHYAAPEAKMAAAAPVVPEPDASAPATAVAPGLFAPAARVPAPAASVPSSSDTAHSTPAASLPAAGISSDRATGKLSIKNEPPAESGRKVGTLLVITGEDNARIFLNGKLQPRLTQAGQLRIPSLEFKDYVVQVSKDGFQDPPRQEIRIRQGEQARVIFNLQPQPRLASLTIQGGVPGTTVLVDQTAMGTIQPDGTLSVSSVNPGDHTVELRKERFKPRQFNKHFVAGEAISLVAADTTLEAVPGELKITFGPADAKVAIVKGELLKMVSSGVPLSLAAGTYTLTARTTDRFTRSSTFDVIAGQSKALNLSLAPSGMSKWDPPAAWKQEGNSFTCKGGNFVLYGVVPVSGTFGFSAMATKGHLLQWVLNYTDPKNYVLFQMDDNNFYRSVIRNGEKTEEIIVPHKDEKKAFRTLQIHISSNEVVQQIKRGNTWTVLDRWSQPSANLTLGKFGFYIPGNDQVAISSFAYYADLNLR